MNVLVSRTVGAHRSLRIALVLVGFTLACALGAASARAQVQLNRFFPPVVAAGQESTITAEGKFPKWPVNFDVDRDAIEIRPGKDSGKLTVVPPADASSGVIWIRMFDEKSASQLVPLIVSPVAVAIEKEPNDKRSEANDLEIPSVVAGRLAKRGDSDAYRVSVKAGQQLVINATANQVLKSPMDAVLQLSDLRGNVLLQSDDGRGLDPQLVYRSDRDQDLLVRIFAFPETPNSTVGFGGASDFVYALEITTGPYLDHVADTESGPRAFGYNLPDDAPVISTADAETVPRVGSVAGALGWSWILPPPEPNSIRTIEYGDPHDGSLPVVVIGHIRERKEAHTIPVAVQKGVKYRAEVRSKVDGFLLDSMLEVVDPKTGSVLASNDDVSRGGYDAGVDFTAKADGTVDVRLTEMLEAFGPRHFYQLAIREQQPTFALSLASDRFVLDGDKPLEIAVSVTRLSGFSGKIRIEALDLPAGVTADPVISEAKGDTAKTVKLKLNTEKAVEGHSSIGVVGTELGESDAPVEPSRKATFALRPSYPISKFWLTVTGQTKEEEK